MNLAEKIRKHGIRRLAAEAGVHPGHISMILNGKRAPSLSLAAKLSEILKVEMRELSTFVASQRQAA